MIRTPIYDFEQGSSPLLVSMPHVGTLLPEQMKKTMTVAALQLPDTDWDVDCLYDFLPDLSVSTLRANYSRYVVDLNRSASNESLYPGQSVTEVCPTTLFDDQPIYEGAYQLEEHQIADRIEKYWKPYYQKIREELERISKAHGYAVLLDAHSIKSRVPRFFTGQLPDLNWGTGDGKTCALSLSKALLDDVIESHNYSTVLNGRFKGGNIVRSFGKPEQSIHAIQLEMSQATYMKNERMHEQDPEKMTAMKEQLQRCVKTLLNHFEKTGVGCTG